MSGHTKTPRAKAKLPELVAIAEGGEDVVTRRASKPAPALQPLVPPKSKARRTLGFWKHLGPMQDPDLFFRPDPELEALMDDPIDPQA